MTTLTLYYDGLCPFCAAEMQRLHRWDRGGQLGFVDISQAGFDPAELGVDMAALGRELHGRDANGRMLVGIDTMLAAYTLVGRGWLVAPLRVAVFRPHLARWYRRFARNRYRISRWLGYRPITRCDGDRCEIGNPFLR
ncbi:thiol-disulfide oxidoreductase DCC family protein [Jeongeupia chitinilytica]|uniref:Redox protein n=1 Tax=Jeongeupia chitinilytica TaxID=1041641 RepID=A0ABQ3H359_9NEIS|nr:DUF393 domain-containing protein [Jeongeupia chitinilytica]GHD65816.1 redox protein [Jeongeupia chitinilytica]